MPEAHTKNWKMAAKRKKWLLLCISTIQVIISEAKINHIKMLGENFLLVVFHLGAGVTKISIPYMVIKTT